MFLTLDDRLLEIGFGRGDGLKLVHDKLNEERGSGCVFGLEASEYMLNLSSKRFTIEISDEGKILLDFVIFISLNDKLSFSNFQVPNIAHLPYPNDTFDGIFHVDVFYFWNREAMPQVVKELSRILKPGGKLICGLEPSRLKKLEKAKVLFSWEHDPMRYTECLEPVGFTDVSVSFFISIKYMLLLLDSIRETITIKRSHDYFCKKTVCIRRRLGSREKDEKIRTRH